MRLVTPLEINETGGWLHIFQDLPVEGSGFNLKAINGSSPRYIKDQIAFYHRQLHSTETMQITEPRTEHKGAGEKVFSMENIQMWSKLL